jgi:predicted Ser/Thr protein kinase
LGIIGLFGRASKKKINSLILRNKKLYDQFLDAVKNGDIFLIKKLLKQGISIFANDEKDSNNILHLAVQSDKIDIFTWFIDRYLTSLQREQLLNAKNFMQETPLDLAKKYSRTKFLRKLKAATIKGKEKFTEVLKNDFHETNRKMLQKKPMRKVKNVNRPMLKPRPSLKESFKERSKEPPKKQPKTYQTTKISKSYIIPYKDIKFNKEDELGTGTFGAVFKGTWQFTDVAVKKLHIQKMTDQTMEFFKKEVSIMSKLHHPNVLPLYGACIERGRYCMVIPYMPKGSLYGVLHSDQKFPWKQRWSIALDIGKGIYHLHKKDILHRDLKSLNVLLDENMQAKVCDFGISRAKQETRTTTATSKTAQSVGTTPWMAPELFKRRAKYDKKCDIYSYGMVLWEIASRKSPWSDAQNASIIIAWVKEGEQEDIPEKCPPSYAKLIKWCWEREPDKRPTIEESVEMLQKNQQEALAMK